MLAGISLLKSKKSVTNLYYNLLTFPLDFSTGNALASQRFCMEILGPTSEAA